MYHALLKVLSNTYNCNDIIVFIYYLFDSKNYSITVSTDALLRVGNLPKFFMYLIKMQSTIVYLLRYFISEASIQYSAKGNPILSWGNNKFYRLTSSDSLRKFWYCSRRRSNKCRARLITENNVFVEIKNVHTHHDGKKTEKTNMKVVN